MKEKISLTLERSIRHTRAMWSCENELGKNPELNIPLIASLFNNVTNKPIFNILKGKIRDGQYI